jgi:hypothetical protein
MQYQTIDQLRQRCADELPGFDLVGDDGLLRAWIWDAMRLIDTDRLGEPSCAEVKVIWGKGELPHDFLGIIGIQGGGNVSACHPRGAYHVVPGGAWLRGYPDGCVSIKYYALPLDDEGYPYILDIAEMGVLAYIEWKFTALQQKKMQMQTAYQFRVNGGLDEMNRQKALSMLSAVRGELNMLSELEVENLRQFRQRVMTYRND